MLSLKIGSSPTILLLAMKLYIILNLGQKKKIYGLALKLDVSKAYDVLNGLIYNICSIILVSSMRSGLIGLWNTSLQFHTLCRLMATK